MGSISIVPAWVNYHVDASRISVFFWCSCRRLDSPLVSPAFSIIAISSKNSRWRTFSAGFLTLKLQDWITFFQSTNWGWKSSFLWLDEAAALWCTWRSERCCSCLTGMESAWRALYTSGRNLKKGLIRAHMTLVRPTVPEVVSVEIVSTWSENNIHVM